MFTIHEGITEFAVIDDHYIQLGKTDRDGYCHTHQSFDCIETIDQEVLDKLVALKHGDTLACPNCSAPATLDTDTELGSMLPNDGKIYAWYNPKEHTFRCTDCQFKYL
jgi:hypothetical protein